jgi:hypothetical protein
MTKVNMSGWTQEQIDNWQDPMSAPQQGPKTGIAGISPLPGLINQHYNPLDMGKYEGNPNHNPDYQNFMNSEFNIGGPGLAVMTDVYYGDNQKNTFGDSSSAAQFRKYLESMGIPIHDGPPQGSQPGKPFIPDDSVRDIMPGPIIDRFPALPNYDDKFAGYDKQIGGFDNQFKDIIGRLDKLEQGIGTMANTDVPAPSPIQGGVPSVYTGPNARGY